MDLVTYELKVPSEMKLFLTNFDKNKDLQRNALLLYPYIYNQTISYGRAAEILGINKYDLIRIYGDLEIPYYSMDSSELEDEIKTFHELKAGLL